MKAVTQDRFVKKSISFNLLLVLLSMLSACLAALFISRAIASQTLEQVKADNSATIDSIINLVRKFKEDETIRSFARRGTGAGDGDQP